MAEAKQYIVTRGGREVLRGDESDLLNAARGGLVLSNDLIYDSTASQWSFARSLTILRGFPLRDRARAEEVADAEGSVLNTGRRLLSRRRTMGRVLRALGVLLLLILLAATLFLIPDSKQKTKKQKLNNVLDLEERAMKIEGSGSGMSDNENTRQGSSNMDSKRVVVDGEQDDTLETDEEGRKAALLLTTEEMADLATSGNAGNGSSGEAETEASGEQAAAAPEPSPSINAPALPKGVSQGTPTAEQPLVLIRPKIDDLQRKLESLMKTVDEREKVQQSHDISKQLDEIGTELDRAQSEGEGETSGDLKQVIEKIRDKLEENCATLESSEHCRLRIAHPHWSAVALNAVLRKDVILGMDGEQVELSLGAPIERRESGVEAVWCYDKACKKRVEYRKGRVLTFTDGIVRADRTIEESGAKTTSSDTAN